MKVFIFALLVAAVFSQNCIQTNSDFWLKINNTLINYFVRYDSAAGKHSIQLSFLSAYANYATCQNTPIVSTANSAELIATSIDATGAAVYSTYTFTTNDIVSKFNCPRVDFNSGLMDKYTCDFALKVRQTVANGGNQIVQISLTYEVYVIKSTGGTVSLSSQPKYFDSLGVQSIVANVVPNMFISDSTYTTKSTQTNYTYNDQIYIRFEIVNPDLKTLYKVTLQQAVLTCNSIPVPLTALTKSEATGLLTISYRLINTGTVCTVKVDAQLARISRRLMTGSRVLQSTTAPTQMSTGTTDAVLIKSGSIMKIAIALLSFLMIFFI